MNLYNCNSELSEMPICSISTAANAFNIKLTTTSKTSTETIDESDNNDYDKILNEITNTMSINQI